MSGLVLILHDRPSCNIDITWPVESRGKMWGPSCLNVTFLLLCRDSFLGPTCFSLFTWSFDTHMWLRDLDLGGFICRFVGSPTASPKRPSNSNNRAFRTKPRHDTTRSSSARGITAWGSGVFSYQRWSSAPTAAVIVPYVVSSIFRVYDNKGRTILGLHESLIPAEQT